MLVVLLVPIVLAPPPASRSPSLREGSAAEPWPSRELLGLEPVPEVEVPVLMMKVLAVGLYCLEPHPESQGGVDDTLTYMGDGVSGGRSVQVRLDTLPYPGLKQDYCTAPSTINIVAIGAPDSFETFLSHFHGQYIRCHPTKGWGSFVVLTLNKMSPLAVAWGKNHS